MDTVPRTDIGNDRDIAQTRHIFKPFVPSGADAIEIPLG
jgi:hypothetical protein